MPRAHPRQPNIRLSTLVLAGTLADARSGRHFGEQLRLRVREDCCVIATSRVRHLGIHRQFRGFCSAQVPRGGRPGVIDTGARRSWLSYLFGWMQPSPPHPDTGADQPSSPDRIPARGPLTFSRQRSKVLGLRLRPWRDRAGPSQCKSASARLHPASSGGLAGFYARCRARG
jgi:hypothetical protein